MMGKLKSLGVVLAAVLALGAVVSSGAMADTFQTEGGQEVTLTGAQEEVVNKFTFVSTAGSVTCPTTTFHAQAKSGVSTVETTQLKFSASGCLCIGIACNITTNGCNLRFHIITTVGTVDLVCPVGKELTMDSTKCIIHVPPQESLAWIIYSNTGFSGTSTAEVTVKAEVEHILYTHTKVGEGIGSCTSGFGTMGRLNGSAIVTGEKVWPGTGHVGIFVS